MPVRFDSALSFCRLEIQAGRLSRPPGRFGLAPSVRAIGHDVGDRIPKLGPSLGQGLRATLFFWSIMKQAGDSLVLVVRRSFAAGVELP
jgi:hypothetical protein